MTPTLKKYDTGRVEPLLIRPTFAQLYRDALAMCYHAPHFVASPRGQKVKELVNVTLLLTDPRSNLFYNEARSPSLNYLAGELTWYFSGDNGIEFIRKYSKFWDRIKNDNGTLNSAYGNLLFVEENEIGVTQWQWAVKSLQLDKDSRQAILHFNKPHHQKFGTKDFPCTLFAQFLIREDALHMHVTMRSNDFVFGLTYDLPFFTMLQQNMLLILRETYPDLKLGQYYHNAMSLHIYEKDFEITEKMLGAYFFDANVPLLRTPVVDEMGNPAQEVFDLMNGRYVGDDPFYSWLEENMREKEQ